MTKRGAAIKPTKPRVLWLAHLALHQPVADRPRGPTAFACQQAGWTEPAAAGDRLTVEGWRILGEALDRYLEVEQLLFLRGPSELQQRMNARLLAELGRAGQPSVAMAAEVEALARVVMRLTEAAGAERLVVLAALWRCVAGFHARLTLDAGDPCTLAAASLLEGAFQSAGLAEALAQSRVPTVRPNPRPNGRPSERSPLHVVTSGPDPAHPGPVDRAARA